jgi:hypothetical protein
LSSPGSNPHAARIATGELLAQGCSRLESLFGGHVASFGGVCWQTDAQVGETLRRPDRRRYHPESIARSRRKLRDRGIITSDRVFVGGKIPSIKAKYRSARGTTVKTFIWSAIEQKNPFSRHERRIKRQEQARRSREAGELRPPTPPYVSARAIVEPVRMPATLLDPEFERIVGKLRTLSERGHPRETPDARAAQVAGYALAPERPPPE